MLAQYIRAPILPGKPRSEVACPKLAVQLWRSEARNLLELCGN